MVTIPSLCLSCLSVCLPVCLSVKASHYMSMSRRLIKRETRSDGWQHIRATLMDTDGHCHLAQLGEQVTTFRSRGSTQEDNPR